MMPGQLPECPSFPDWYRAINGRSPFPWQARLADQVVSSRGWPGLVGIPTGLGKTACVDIAIWALAHQAHRPPDQRTAPTRLWWVVNRRLLVDDTYRHAAEIAERLAASTGGPVRAVATRLRYIGGQAGTVPLEVVQLRGARRRSDELPGAWVRGLRPSTPAQPAVICSTIPMFGSRILFRGYGSSRSMRPIDAALAYMDSLVIIDEAHLAVHLQRLLEDLAEVAPPKTAILPGVRQSPTVVALTATGDADVQRFDLAEDDRNHATIRQRLKADKPVHLLTMPDKSTKSQVVTKIATAVEELLTDASPGVSLVFVNSPITARHIHQRLTKRLRNAHVMIATGQIRGYDAKRITEDILREAGSTRNGPPRRSHLIIVATQTLEVGADIDADYLVTEACGVRALTQRLGRLNRLGKRPHAKAVYIHSPPDKRGSWPVYGQEPAAVLERLHGHMTPDGLVALPPGEISKILGDPQDRPEPAPVVARGLLWEWVKTTIPPPGEAPTNPYFAGFDDTHRHLNIAWRAYLPGESGPEKLWPRLRRDETVEVPVSDAIKALNALDASREDAHWVILDPRHRATPAAAGDLRPGDTVIVRSDVGWLDDDGHWDPKSTGVVLDTSISDAGLPIAPDVLERVYAPETLPKRAARLVSEILKVQDNGEDEEEERESKLRACRRLCRTLSTAIPYRTNERHWLDFISDVRDGIEHRANMEHAILVSPHNEVSRLPFVGRSVRTGIDDGDGLSLLSENADLRLTTHGDDTARVAARIVKAAGVTTPPSRAVVLAARLHDVGKADLRFQRSLKPNRVLDDDLVAKSRQPRSMWSATRANAGWPRGGRHEELSRRLVEQWIRNEDHGLDADEADLLQHLVVSHHGHGRPFVMPVRDTSAPSSLPHDLGNHLAVIDPDLAIPDWSQPPRFATLNDLYGHWGLALLEAIVRQSDHTASSLLEVQ